MGECRRLAGRLSAALSTRFRNVKEQRWRSCCGPLSPSRLFTDRAGAEVCLTMRARRLMAFGVPQVNGTLFDVNRELSAIGRDPL